MVVVPNAVTTIGLATIATTLKVVAPTMASTRVSSIVAAPEVIYLLIVATTDTMVVVPTVVPKAVPTVVSKAAFTVAMLVAATMVAAIVVATMVTYGNSDCSSIDGGGW